jgi:1,4-alpha-glucan branching enzyme
MNSFLQKIGAWCDGAATEFIVWAPLHENVRLFIASPQEAVYPMQKDDMGYWRLTIPVSYGTRYGFRPGDHEDTLPDPAYLFGPYFTDRYRTPWGNALNFDGAWSDGVRNFFLQNARMWLEELHVAWLAMSMYRRAHFLN